MIIVHISGTGVTNTSKFKKVALEICCILRNHVQKLPKKTSDTLV